MSEAIAPITRLSAFFAGVAAVICQKAPQNQEKG
jgi:hypothetical protein